jgi:hypothetical protein
MKPVDNTTKKELLPVAEMKPGDFPLGSLESRVAARALVEARSGVEKLILNVHLIHAHDGHAGRMGEHQPHLISRQEGSDCILQIWD